MMAPGRYTAPRKDARIRTCSGNSIDRGSVVALFLFDSWDVHLCSACLSARVRGFLPEPPFVSGVQTWI